MAEPTINELMSTYAEEAVQFAESTFGVVLDYSTGSVEQVEIIAEQLYDSRPKGFWNRLFKRGPSEDEVQTVCKMLGGYIGEVFRRAKGGEWAMHEELSAVGLKRNDSWIFPPDKVHKRLTVGADENLWVYFRIVLAEPWGKKAKAAAEPASAPESEPVLERATPAPSVGAVEA